MPISASLSQMGLEYNAFEIATKVEESSKPVILITHSKGGIDVLSAFVSFPEMTKNGLL